MMKKVEINLRKMLREEKGEGIITALYTMLLLTMVFFIGIDIFGYTGTVWKLRNACNETLTLMKIENGFDSSTERVFFGFLHKQGLDTSQVEVSGTGKLVQRGDLVTISAATPYVLRSLRPFGQELKFSVKVQMSGLAQDFVR